MPSADEHGRRPDPARLALVRRDGEVLEGDRRLEERVVALRHALEVEVRPPDRLLAEQAAERLDVCAFDRADDLRRVGRPPDQRLGALRLRVERRLQVLQDERVVEHLLVGRRDAGRLGVVRRDRREAGRGGARRDDEAGAREAVVRLGEGAVDVDQVEPLDAHDASPTVASSCRTLASSYGTSMASGAGSPLRMLRIHAA
jgi:hypothetical protein